MARVGTHHIEEEVWFCIILVLVQSADVVNLSTHDRYPPPRILHIEDTVVEVLVETPAWTPALGEDICAGTVFHGSANRHSLQAQPARQSECLSCVVLAHPLCGGGALMAHGLGWGAPTTTRESVSPSTCDWKPRMSLTSLTNERSSFLAMLLRAARALGVGAESSGSATVTATTVSSQLADRGLFSLTLSLQSFTSKVLYSIQLPLVPLGCV